MNGSKSNCQEIDYLTKMKISIKADHTAFTQRRTKGVINYGQITNVRCHTAPCELWKIDSWEDKKYWELMQRMSTAIQRGIDLYSFDFMCHEYEKGNQEGI